MKHHLTDVNAVSKCRFAATLRYGSGRSHHTSMLMSRVRRLRPAAGARPHVPEMASACAPAASKRRFHRRLVAIMLAETDTEVIIDGCWCRAPISGDRGERRPMRFSSNAFKPGIGRRWRHRACHVECSASRMIRRPRENWRRQMDHHIAASGRALDLLTEEAHTTRRTGCCTCRMLVSSLGRTMSA